MLLNQVSLKAMKKISNESHFLFFQKQHIKHTCESATDKKTQKPTKHFFLFSQMNSLGLSPGENTLLLNLIVPFNSHFQTQAINAIQYNLIVIKI